MARYDPFEEMDRMFEQLRTRMWTLDRLGRTDFGASALGGSINMDLKKYGDQYVFVADLPGFETEEIDLTFEGDALVLSAESSLHEETMGDEMTTDEMAGDEPTGRDVTDEKMATERTTADTDELAVRREFTRSRRVSERITIPEEIVADEISATYRNGVSASSASGGSPDLRSGGVLEVHLPLVGSEADEDDGRKIDIAD